MKKKTNKTADREKVAVWIDNEDLKALRKMQMEVGVPIAEQIRRLIHDGLQEILNTAKRQFHYRSCKTHHGGACTCDSIMRKTETEMFSKEKK